MEHQIFQTLTITAGLLLFFSSVYYIWLVYKREIKPSLSGMLVFSMSTLLGGLSTAINVGWQAGFVPCVGGFINLCIFALALKEKNHTSWNNRDSLLILLGVCGAFGWWYFSNPWVALSSALLIDVCGYAAVFHKMKDHPGEEDTFAWGAAAIAYLLPIVGYLFFKSDIAFVWSDHIFALLNSSLCGVVTAWNFLQNTKTIKV